MNEEEIGVEAAAEETASSGGGDRLERRRRPAEYSARGDLESFGMKVK
jgi:hypothetical protein